MTAWRCFVAVPLDDTLRREIATAVEGWMGAPATSGLRWVDPEALHLTLAFLGATDPADVPTLAAEMQRVVGEMPGFELGTGRLGAFPSRRRARVAWYGIDDRDRRLATLAAQLRRALGVVGTPFRAHITLARARREAGLDLRDWIREARAPAGRLKVDRVQLMRSHIGRGPAQYETLAATTLRASVHA